MAKRKKMLSTWTPFEQMNCLIDADGRKMPIPDGMLLVKNSRYQVVITKCPPAEPFGEIIWLSIKRIDRMVIRDWRDLQRIKNEILGEEVEAVELFPAESRLVDTSNQYHLFCFPGGYKLPFGYQERLVVEIQGTHALSKKAKQRPFEKRPEDLLTQTAEELLIQRLLKSEHPIVVAATKDLKQDENHDYREDEVQNVVSSISCVGPASVPTQPRENQDDDQ